MTTLFDAEHQLQRTRAFQDFLLDLLAEFGQGKRAIDVGCGFGLISQARAENVAEGSRRFPDLDFRVCDAEDTEMRSLGRFDIVVCSGLLNHLDNPFMVVRNLYEVSDDVLVVESMVAPGKNTPMLVLRAETSGEDKALRNVSLLPTEICLLGMCYQAGFSHVWRPPQPPDNVYYRATWGRRR